MGNGFFQSQWGFPYSLYGPTDDILDVVELDYQKTVMAGMKWTNECLRDADAPNREFVFLVEKG